MPLDLQQAIEDFWTAQQPGGAYPARWEGNLSQEAAYRVQLTLLDRHVAAGRRQAGWKVGLTARAIREQFGMPEPVFACLFEQGRWASGGTWPLSAMKEPGFENELCITLGEKLKGPGISEERARRAIATVAPAMEIIETRVPNRLPAINSMIADNGQQFSFVVGTPVKFDPVRHDLGRATVEVLIDGAVVDRAPGSAVMESSAAASVAWLANKLAEHGRAIDPGQALMTGSFTRQFRLDRPMRIEARFAPFGSATAQFV